MGKSYSYSIVVEQAGALFMNEQEVPLPEEVIADGTDPLGWALDQVRSFYAGRFEADSTSELNLSVRDRRPGGLVRRARFTNPNAGIDLETFLQPRQGRGRTAEARSSAPASRKNAEETTESDPGAPPEKGPRDEGVKYAETVEPPGTRLHADSRSPDSALGRGSESVEGEKAETHAKAEESSPRRLENDSQHGSSGRGSEAKPQLAEATSYEEKVQRERGWKKLDRGTSTRPQVGSAENAGRSRSQGLLELGKRQKTRNIIAAVVVIVAVIVGFRIFNGGTSYEAVCVDQRTMTRAVTGVACENEMDTNHRWWYASDSSGLPGPGDTIDRQSGTFDEPKGAKDTINYHIEDVDESQ